LDKPRKALEYKAVYCGSVLETVAATIYLDLFKGTEFKSCLWCKRIFEPTRENGRTYCDHNCAHRAGQKSRRAAAKALQASLPKRKSKIRKGKGKTNGTL
jgi:hypothetical protein